MKVPNEFADNLGTHFRAEDETEFVKVILPGEAIWCKVLEFDNSNGRLTVEIVNLPFWQHSAEDKKGFVAEAFGEQPMIVPELHHYKQGERLEVHIGEFGNLEPINRMN